MKRIDQRIRYMTWAYGLLLLLVGLSTSMAAAAQPEAVGPRKRIAVYDFEANNYGGYSADGLGRGLAEQLITALVRTDRFIVLERGALFEPARNEQALGEEGATTDETAPETGQLLGAQILIQGTVTEFAEETEGNGLKVGVKRFKKLKGLKRVGLGTETTTGRVVFDLRLVDAATGQVLQAHRVETEAKGSRFSVDVEQEDIDLGSVSFGQSGLGAATRAAVEQAVAFVVEVMQAVPWTGRVVDVIDGAVYLNAGAGTGLAPGDTLHVSTATQDLVDPETGLHLGALEEARGAVVVEAVEEHYAVARRVGDVLPQRGDLVRVQAP